MGVNVKEGDDKVGNLGEFDGSGGSGEGRCNSL